MNLSYWEHKTWGADIDYAVIGSGIVGLSCALALRKKNPNSKIVVFEKGTLPSGASTKNAGFACFGSISEIIEDLKTHNEEEVIQLVRDRVAGLQLLRETLGDELIGYQEHGGYELFSEKDNDLFLECLSKIPYVNELLRPVFGTDVFSIRPNEFQFRNVHSDLIFNQFEGQIDTGKMMQGLIQKASENGIFILNSTEIHSFSTQNDHVLLKTSLFEHVKTKQVFIATNGFAKQFLDADVVPARAQVLVTQPIPDLKIIVAFV